MEKKVLKEEGSPEIYTNKETGKGVIILSNRTVKKGSIQVKKDKYYYFQYRQGKKVIQKYLGKL